MATCDYCGTSILFGGVTDNGLRFCNDACHERGVLMSVANQAPQDFILQQVVELHQGNCPHCNGPGPVDVHTSHYVWSILVMTSWNSSPKICCRSCGVKAKLGAAALSCLVGWWGLPWGLILTPIQVGRNLLGLFGGPDPTVPSAQLENLVKLNLAAALLEAEPPDEEEPISAEVVSPR